VCSVHGIPQLTDGKAGSSKKKAAASTESDEGAESLYAPVLRNLETIVTTLRAKVGRTIHRGRGCVRNINNVCNMCHVVQGVRVCVCDVPTVGRASSPLGKIIRAYNQQLEASVETEGGRWVIGTWQPCRRECVG
jgi:hypothetical protein